MHVFCLQPKNICGTLFWAPECLQHVAVTNPFWCPKVAVASRCNANHTTQLVFLISCIKLLEQNIWKCSRVEPRSFPTSCRSIVQVPHTSYSHMWNLFLGTRMHAAHCSQQLILVPKVAFAFRCNANHTTPLELFTFCTQLLQQRHFFE